ncbi:unnamed protein product [Leptidea sinapis]|uniref:DUF4746 domain-containing protein n=1 Tax=Leptidea sinapis TaxID=189913 RepID=A0A5E4QC18_9NEOP|nr:unnamed protein product [Leptidea sinapis]
MARKGQVSIQETVESNEEFEAYLAAHSHQLICEYCFHYGLCSPGTRAAGMEVYSEFCGHCLATGNAIRKGKLEIGQDQIAMVKVLADKVDAVSRFRDKSEPVFLFVLKGKLTRAMFGSNGIELNRIMEEELAFMKKELDTGVERPKRAIQELLPEEAARIEADLKLEEEYKEAAERLRVLTLAARKRRVCERLSHHVTKINFIMFWPHCHQAHFDQYEKWDLLNLNPACLHALLSGEVLVVLFKMLDTDYRDFVRLMRHALYEEIPIPKEDVPPEKRVPPIPAYERYATISKTAREVRRERYEAKMQKLKVEEDGAEEVEGVERAEGEEGEEGEVAATEATEEVEDLGEDGEVEQEFHSDVSVEGEEYIPPGGLLVPGLYTPPNALAKANGLVLFFPKVVAELTTIESEFLPPHVLVMFHVDKRQEVQEVMQQFPEEILNYGIFVGDDPYAAEHLAFTIKQYNQMERLRKHKDRLAVMVSRRRSLPLLQLAGLNPTYISADAASGERECLALFPVGYGDDYLEEESLHEEEIKEVDPEPEPKAEPEVAEEAANDDDKEIEDDD